MALPADALKAVVTVGVSSDISGVIGTIKKLRVQLDECVLIWAKTGHTIEDWSTESVDASFIELEVLADQPGLLTSGLVDGKPSLVEIQGWPLLATWTVEHPNGKIRKRSRHFSSSILTPGSTVDLGLIPDDGLVPPSQITYAQSLDFSTDMVADLSVGTVATGAPGTPAVASLTPVGGDAYTLDLTIPQGADGDPAPLPAFTATATTGAPGTNAAASVSGTYPNLSLDLTIPEGEQGNPGPPNSLAIGTVTTGAPGSAAAASVTGTAPSQTLNLTIPRGYTGDPTAYELRGTGMPNGVVTAPPGTYYTDTAGTNGAWRWLKTSGTGNTGWTVVVGDTGWRSLLTTDLSNGWQRVAVGQIITRRVGARVDFISASQGISGTSATSPVFVTLPAGFRVRPGPRYVAIGSGFVSGTDAPRKVVSDAEERTLSLGAVEAGPITFALSWWTDDAWPTIRPYLAT